MSRASAAQDLRVCQVLRLVLMGVDENLMKIISFRISMEVSSSLGNIFDLVSSCVEFGLISRFWVNFKALGNLFVFTLFRHTVHFYLSLDCSLFWAQFLSAAIGQGIT